MYEHQRDCGGSAAPGVRVRMCVCVWSFKTCPRTRNHIYHMHTDTRYIFMHLCNIDTQYRVEMCGSDCMSHVCVQVHTRTCARARVCGYTVCRSRRQQQHHCPNLKKKIHTRPLVKPQTLHPKPYAKPQTFFPKPSLNSKPYTVNPVLNSNPKP